MLLYLLILFCLSSELAQSIDSVLAPYYATKNHDLHFNICERTKCGKGLIFYYYQLEGTHPLFNDQGYFQYLWEEAAKSENAADDIRLAEKASFGSDDCRQK
jgi:hypothetical protein